MSINGVASSSAGLQERLNDPKVVDGLNRLLDRLDTVSFAVESLDGFIRRGDVIAESIADTVSDLKGLDNGKAKQLLEKAPQMIETGTKLADAAGDMDVEELARSKILERLTDPETLSVLNRLLDRLPLAAFMLEAVEGLLARGETITDNISEALRETGIGELEIDTDQLKTLIESVPKLAEAGQHLMNSELMNEGLPKVIDAGVVMIESGMLDKNVVSMLGQLGRQSAETFREVTEKPIQPVGGLLATLRATKDPDVQKSVGFFFAFAKAFAKHLK
jgi:hypothetical protein